MDVSDVISLVALVVSGLALWKTTQVKQREWRLDASSSIADNLVLAISVLGKAVPVLRKSSDLRE